MSYAQKLKKSHLYLVKDGEAKKINKRKIHTIMTTTGAFVEGRVEIIGGKLLHDNVYYELDDIVGIEYRKAQFGKGAVAPFKWVGKGAFLLGALMIGIVALEGDDEDDDLERDIALLAAGGTLLVGGGVLTFLAKRAEPRVKVETFLTKDYQFIFSEKRLL